MKYGIIIKVTEEFLSQFLSEHVLNNDEKLTNAVKSIVGENWNIETKHVECKVQRRIENDTFLFRLKSKMPTTHFVAVNEGTEYPYVGWFGKSIQEKYIYLKDRRGSY